IDNFSLKVTTPVFGFLGQNGAGKTTIMKMIVGISRPDSGTITLGDKAPHELETREHVGFMPEAAYFYDRLTGLEFLSFVNELFKNRDKKSVTDIEALLKKVGIYDARHHHI